MKDVYLRFYEENIIVFEDKVPPILPYYNDRDSISNALNLIRDVYKTHDKFFYEIDETENTYPNLVNYKLGIFFHLCIWNTSHTFFIEKQYRDLTEVDISFGLHILDETIKTILS